MIKRAVANGLPFDWVACDTLYGRKAQFRADLDVLGVQYAADVPANTQVYLHEPRVGIPKKHTQAGHPRTRRQVLSRQKPVEVRAWARRAST